MANSPWVIYARERFPIAVYLLLAGGYACSGVALTGQWNNIPVLYSLFGCLLFFWLLRLMDELKDYDKDKIANPTRPLPRGLLQVAEVSHQVNQLAWGMVVFAGILSVRFNVVGGLCYLGLTGHLWLMYREFYLGEWLQARPLLYAVSHQLSLMWLTSFPVLIANPAYLYRPELYLFGTLCLGAFFTYEISRKLNPKAAPILLTYRQVYGVRGCFALVSCTTVLAAVSAWSLGLRGLWLIECLVPLSFILISKPKGHKIVETLATLSLAAHLWAVALISMKEWWT